MKSRLRHFSATLVVLLTLMSATALQTGCSTGWQDGAKKAVVASTKVYDLAMTIAGSSGVSAAKQAEIVRIANIYRSAASAALAAADSGDVAGYNAHVAEFSKAITDLLALLQGHAQFNAIEKAVIADRSMIARHLVPVGGR